MVATLDRLTGVFSSLSAEAENLAARVRQSVVVVGGEGGGHGSGIIWQEGGVILTNSHVVHRDRAEVSLADGRHFAAEVFRRDPARDLAALRVPAAGLPAAAVGDSRAIRPGELVLAVGNPLGARGAVAIGIFSGLVRDLQIGHLRLAEMVQADVDLYPGNSGGPLVDARGGVVGINSMVTGPGIALAVPSHVVQEFLGEDSSQKAYLGVTVQQVPLPAALSERANGHAGLLDGHGLMVLAVAEGSPAERAGLILGDVLTAVDGRVVTAPDQLPSRLAAIGPDRPVRLAVLRGGQIVVMDGVVGKRKEG